MNKIVVTKDMNLFDDQLKKLRSLGEVKIYTNLNSKEEWLNACKDADIICSGVFGLKSDKVYELKNKFISIPFVGAEFLDLRKLKENNVHVSNSPGCNKESVAEWIIGMLLMSFRNLNVVTRAKDVPKQELLKNGLTLCNKNITILGYGNIGKHLGKICEAFEMNVTYFKRGNNLINSIKDADIIANCLSLNSETTGLLDKEFFSSLKKGSFFISIARPMTYDISALKNALDKGILSGAADDAGCADGGELEDPIYIELLSHPKILVTPHIAWNTYYEKRKGNDMMINNIEAWLNKKPINILE